MDELNQSQKDYIEAVLDSSDFDNETERDTWRATLFTLALAILHLADDDGQ